jgi:hypothetical protein
MTEATTCTACQRGAHVECERRAPFVPASGSEATLVGAVFGDSVTTCCCESRGYDGWSPCPRPACFIPDTDCVMGFDVDTCPHRTGDDFGSNQTGEDR